MGNGSSLPSKVLAESAARVLRRELVKCIAPVLSESDKIESPDTRLTIQAQCLDLIIALEEIIDSYELEECNANQWSRT